MSMTLKNKFYQAKKNFFKYAILPTLAITASCSLTKEFIEDDLYYSPKDDLQKTEIAYVNSLKNQGVEVDTLEIKSVQDLNYAIKNGADAISYWENYFTYSPYKSSLGWDFDGDGIVNAFDIHPYNYDFFDDINNNGISDALEFSYYFPTTLDFIYLDLYWNYHSWNNGQTQIYYFDYDKDWIESFSRRQRSLTTRVFDQPNTRIRRSGKIGSRIVREDRTHPKIKTTNRQRYERPRTQERTNTTINYNPKTNTKTQNTRTIRRISTHSNRQQNTTTRSSNSTVRSSSSNSKSSGSSNSKSSSSNRNGRRR